MRSTRSPVCTLALLTLVSAASSHASTIGTISPTPVFGTGPIETAAFTPQTGNNDPFTTTNLLFINEIITSFNPAQGFRPGVGHASQFPGHPLRSLCHSPRR